jgi:thiol:disulfide interchange protein DsbD
MVRFKQGLAFPMYATAGWLVWVLSLQAGDAALLAALGGAVAIAFAAWLWTVAREKRWNAAAPALGVLVAVALVAWVARQEPAGASGAKPADARWSAFTPERLQALRDEGKPVFVNFTAAWCVTCIVNEKAALQSEAVFAAMKRKGMAPMKADWTRKDATIARELAKFGRNGVPLYVLYPAARDNREPVVMPQILLESDLLAEIEKFPDLKPKP